MSDGSGRPRQWLRLVNTPHSQAELDALHLAVKKSRPYGGDRWSAKIIAEHDLISTTRGRGWPVITD